MAEKRIKFLEALLFASEGVISRDKIKRFMSLNDENLDEVIKELQKKYEDIDSSFRLQVNKENVILSVQDEFVPKIKDFIEAEFSSAILKTLAMVAYKSPITQSDIIKARGNKSYAHINELLSLGLICSEDFGKTKRLRLTPKFFKYFNLNEKDFRKVLRKKEDSVNKSLSEFSEEKKETEESTIKNTEKKEETIKEVAEIFKKDAEEVVEDAENVEEMGPTVQEGDRKAAEEFFSS